MFRYYKYFGILSLILILLKMNGVIGWNWFWVISPLLILPALFILLIVVALSIAFILHLRYNVL